MAAQTAAPGLPRYWGCRVRRASSSYSEGNVDPLAPHGARIPAVTLDQALQDIHDAIFDAAASDPPSTVPQLNGAPGQYAGLLMTTGVGEEDSVALVLEEFEMGHTANQGRQGKQPAPNVSVQLLQAVFKAISIARLNAQSSSSNKLRKQVADTCGG
jgi:hypothetical protein